MLTIEKLQSFIDDLRLGKYDNERYEITTTCVRDLETKTDVYVYWYKRDHEYIEKKYYIFNKYKWIKLNHPKYFISINNVELEVSEKLYDSYNSYFTEISHKIGLIQRLNTETYFGL